MTATRETFQNIYDDVLDRLRLTDANMGKYSRSIVCRAINGAQHEIALVLARKGDQFLGTSATASIVVDQEIYTIGPSGDFNVANYMVARQVLVIDPETGSEKPLQKIAVAERHLHIYTGTQRKATDLTQICHYYFTASQIGGAGAMQPAIGLVPLPGVAGTSALKMYYVFKPTPVTYTDDTLVNGGAASDLPENVMPVLKTLTVKMLLEQDWAEEKIRIVDPRLAKETVQAEEAVGSQQEGGRTYVDYIEDLAVDYETW